MNSADIALLIQPDQSIDIGLEANDLIQDFGLKTAILISLFSDRRADDDELSPEDTSKRGWWGDLFPDVEGDLIGSKLWLLRREKRTQENLNRAEEFAVESLTWMVEDGVADDVVADASYDDNGTMILAITITSPGTNAQAAFKFKLKWGLEEERN